MLFDPLPAYVPSVFRLKFAVEDWERAGAARLRRRVFCDEQGLFKGDDRDAIDSIAVSIVAISSYVVAPDDVMGTVRIHEAEPGVWFGSRLAVDSSCRRLGALGGALIRLAVGAAHARGCMRFLAHVQIQNEGLFQRLDWRTLEHLNLHGRPHAFMEADLAAYPPIHDGASGFLALTRKAAA